MIFGNINHKKTYSNLDKDLNTCFEYIRNNDLSSYQKGRYEIDNDDIFVNIVEYDTKNIEDGFWEAHKKYIDIHFMIKGKEIINLNFIENLSDKGYKEPEDFLELEGEKSSFVTLCENDFLICFEEDAHMTGIKVDENEPIKKAIFKVKIK